MEAVIEAVERTSRGKNEARRLRVSGRIPAVVYGGRKAARAIAVDPKMLAKILRTELGANTLIALKLPGGGDARVLVQGISDRSGHAPVAARRLLQGRDGQGHPRPRDGRAARRAEGREAAGRRARHRPSADRDRVPAGRHSGAHRGGRHRDDGRAERPRPRHRGQPEVEGRQRSGHDADARHHSEGRRGGGGARRGGGGGGGGACRARGHQEGQEGRGGSGRGAAPAAAAKKEKK